MTFLPDHMAVTPAGAGLSAPTSRIAVWAARFLEADLAAVRAISQSADTRIGRAAAVAISKLGNGYIYPILLAVVLFAWGWEEGRRMLLLGALNAALMHLLYPIIKHKIKRLRPFKVDPQLPSLLKTLDEHSFPSGHAMTITGVLTPVVLLWPAAALSAALLSLCMFWSRVATGHHYPSDVAAGAMLGVGLGYPIALLVLPYV
jgi:undecaprenyl-diphosphatase